MDDAAYNRLAIQRYVLARARLASADELYQIASAMVAEGERPEDGISRLVSEGLFIELQLGRTSLYPTDLICPETKVPYKDLQKLIVPARQAGYTDWEILHWLMTPVSQLDCRHPTDVLQHADIYKLIDEVEQTTDNRLLRELPTPLELLQRGRVEEFNSVAAELR